MNRARRRCPRRPDRDSRYRIGSAKIRVMPHVVLLGDSIFDNHSYAGDEPDVVGHLRALLPEGWQATLLAEDGASTRDFAPQVEEVPEDATQLFLSLGGNDALLNLDLTMMPVASTAEALLLFDERLTDFETNYRRELGRVLALGIETAVCTIYDTDPNTPWQIAPRRLLALWNDVILRVAFEKGLAAVDLRPVCTEPADYEAWIEPSGQGGRKIAEALAEALGLSAHPDG
jgi:GDSL-like Lipase/Acylhydrolase family